MSENSDKSNLTDKTIVAKGLATASDEDPLRASGGETEDPDSQQEAGVKSLAHSRSGHLSHLTRLTRQVEVLMLDPKNCDAVKSLVTQVDQVYANVMKAHDLYISKLEPSQAIDQQSEAFKLTQHTNKVEFDTHISHWLKRVDTESPDKTHEGSVGHGKHLAGSAGGSVGSGGSRASLKVKEARIKQKLAEMRLPAERRVGTP